MVVAAGRGERLGGPPKQFRSLGGRPVVCWSAHALLESLAGPIVIVLPADGLGSGERLVRSHLERSGTRLRFVAGGARRQDSVRAGLAALAGETIDAVLVHDAVRPFASPALVRRVAEASARGAAVVPALPAPDTLKRIEGDRVVGTLDRGAIVAVQTPQGFPLEGIAAAHAGWPRDEEATDDAAVCERAGMPVVWIQGEAQNRKLTGPDDWWWAEEVVASGRVAWEVERG